MGLGKLLRPLNFSFGKADAVKTGRFLVFFIVAYVALSIFARTVLTVQGIELWVAGNVLGFLSLFGQAGTVSLGETALIELASGTVIEISELCTGLMETLIIVGAILASIGISWKKRLLGAVAAGILTISLNHFRIVFTALLILETGNLEMIEFAHNVLFRIFLFVTIAGFYIAWFYLAVREESALGKFK